MQVPDTELPIEAVIAEVRAALDGRGLAVLTAEPGAGKTTVVPLRLLDEPWLGDGRILVLEPRRVAARAVARRMAALLGESVGDTVGWRTRDDKRISARTRIEVITEGILTRRLQRDPNLPGVSAVLFDEFHERSVHADLGLALCLEVRESIRDELRLLVMSATIDANAVADLLGGELDAAPIIECEGRTHPIDVRWRPRKSREPLSTAVVAGVDEALKAPGDVLVFLPGVGEIKRAAREIERRFDVAVRPLYGALTAEEQDLALRPVDGLRRVVVSTDVAETSLTVEGVGSVVDSGLARRPRYDPASGLSKLVTIAHSRSSADQRAGRAGRLAPGVAVRLWSKMEHASRKKHDDPEILQIDLASVVLESLAWGVAGPGELRLLDQPTTGSVEEAFEVLAMLGAVDTDRRITAAGRQMLALPLHPRLASMVAAAGDGPLGWPAAVLATLLSERDVIVGRPSDRPVDMWSRVQLVLDTNFRLGDADIGAVRSVRRRANELMRRTNAAVGAVSIDDLGRTLTLAYPDRVAQKRAGQGGRFRLRNGMGAEIDRSDPLAHEDMLVVAELAGDKRNARVMKAASIAAIDIELGFAAEMTERVFFGWDDERDDLVTRVERRLGALDFGTHEHPSEPGEATVEALVERIVETNLDVLSWTASARTLQARARAAIAAGFLSDAPFIDNETLLADASDLFGARLQTATRRVDIERLDVTEILRTRLGWETCRTLDELAPTTWRTNRGREVSIDYTADAPSVSVRAQDAFGVVETPQILGGQVPITFELLSPADRTIQITSDLAAFWSGSWSEVRKDMAGRYPKHDWPVDPGAK